MHNAATVIGYLTERYVDDRGTVFLVIEDRSKEKPSSTAVRCWNDKTKTAAGDIKEGSLVKVDGYVRSNKSSQGRWFTDFEAGFVRSLGGGGEEHPGVAAAKKMFGKAREPGSDDF